MSKNNGVPCNSKDVKKETGDVTDTISQSLIPEMEIITDASKLEDAEKEFKVVKLPIKKKAIRVYHISGATIKEIDAQIPPIPEPRELGFNQMVPAVSAQGIPIPGALPVQDYNNPVYIKKIEEIEKENNRKRGSLRRLAALRDIKCPGESSDEQAQWLERKFTQADLITIDSKISEFIFGEDTIRHFLAGLSPGN